MFTRIENLLICGNSFLQNIGLQVWYIDIKLLLNIFFYDLVRKILISGESCLDLLGNSRVVLLLKQGLKCNILFQSGLNNY